ncbi:hypothetical protein MAXJ12_12492 [Mesorhizobium alhagi CCNWXJ12-2]|uniref:Uncharacterized protein n=1 Tax=Mesorhizobium alhagi CCNWXJ12-2 TaxID=1107882 RepID=H0HQR8_9HYPH|nr:hypothetical protein MAXJ12_12492 [Mesorhizobium alhagi CCNWXJ12-2]
MDWAKDVWTAIFESLKGHPEATLAATMVFAGGGMLAMSINPWASCGLPAVIYVGYCLRMTGHDKHSERMAELDVQKIEKSRGAKTRQRAQKILERRRDTNGRR